MSLTPTIYSSSDAGAPSLSGQAGALAALLDAILVDGYGAGQSAKSPLGWTREYQQGGTLRVYRNSPDTGTGHYVRIDDSRPIYATVTGYELMTDIGSGSGQFPLSTQRADGVAWGKSSAASGLSRAWWAIGNEYCFYLFIDTHGTGIEQAPAVNFAGNFIRSNVTDGWNFAISDSGATSIAAGAYQSMRLLYLRTVIDANPISTSTLVLARAQDGRQSVLGACAGGGPVHQEYPGWQGLGTSGFAYPEPISGSLLYCRMAVLQGPQQIRGFMPGIFQSMHHAGIADMQRIEDVDGLPDGTTLLCKVARAGNGTQYPRALFDLTNPW